MTKLYNTKKQATEALNEEHKKYAGTTRTVQEIYNPMSVKWGRNMHGVPFGQTTAGSIYGHKMRPNRVKALILEVRSDNPNGLNLPDVVTCHKFFYPA